MFSEQLKDASTETMVISGTNTQVLKLYIEKQQGNTEITITELLLKFCLQTSFQNINLIHLHLKYHLHVFIELTS